MTTTTSTEAVGRRGAKSFATAIAISQACALLRYVMLARLLGPQELGWAVMIVLTGQFFDSVTDSGSDRFLIQDPSGDHPAAQSLVHFTALIRGAIIAAALLLLAGPIARFLEAPTIEPGLRLLALAPLISGFIHLDLRRVQRHHDFRIEGRATMLAEIASLAATAAVAIATHSYIAIVFGLITRASVLVIVSQSMALRRFAAWPSRELAMKLAIFGLPLMLNGLVLFFGQQGDRVVITKLLGAAEVGRYSAVTLLIFYPIMVLQRYVSSIYLPQLTRAVPDRGRNADALGGVALVVASACTVGFAIVAPLVLPLLFGDRFAQLPAIVALIGVLNAARFLKLWPINMMLADGRSHWVLLTNVARLVSLPLAMLGTWLFPSLAIIVLAFVGGEFLSLALGLWLGNSALRTSRRKAAGRLAMYVLVCVTTVAAGEAWQAGSTALLAGAGIALCLASAVVVVRERAAIAFLWQTIAPRRLRSALP